MAAGGGFAPAQDAAHAGDQFAWLEGFQHVVVGTQFETHDAVADMGAAGQDHDAAGRLGAYPLHGLDAIHVRQAEVDDAQIGRQGAQTAQQIAGAAAPDGAKAEVGEHLLDDFGDVGVVLDDGDQLLGFDCLS